MLYLKADTITEVTVGPAVAVGDGFTPVTNLVGSSADEFEIIKHGATTTTTIAGTLAAITGADGYYALDLSATDTNTEGRLVLLINDDSLILPIRHEFMVVNANVFDSLFAAATTDYLQIDLLQAAGGAIPTPAVTGVPDVNVTHAADTAWASGAITATALGADCITAAKIADNAFIAANFAASSLNGKGDWSTHAATDIVSNGAITTLTGAVTNVTNVTANCADVTNLSNLPSIPANWITAAGIATDAIDADALAADALVEIKTQATTALSDIDLDHLVNTATAIPAITAGTFLDQMFDDGTAVYDRTTDSLQAIRDHVGDGSNLTEAGGDGDHLTAINLPNQTMDITGDITGNLSGSVGSVTGAVGSVTGAVGSVTAEVTADVTKISGSTAAADNLEESTETLLLGTVSGTPTTTTLISDITVTDDDQFKGRIIIFRTATDAGLVRQATDITGCTASTNTLTFTALTVAPTSGDTIIIV